MKNIIHISALIVSLLWFGNVQAQSLEDVQNLSVSGATITWDPVPSAAGYNIYRGGLPAPSMQGGEGFQYLDTVTSSTSFTAQETRLYKIVAFSAGGASFGNLASAPIATVVIGEEGGDGTPPTSPFEDTPPDSVTVTDYNDSLGRYLVRAECRGNRGICTASCNVEGRLGYATGGACLNDNLGVSDSVAGVRQYSCYVNPPASTLTAMAYCAQ